jgi:hypothetical protein
MKTHVSKVLAITVALLVALIGVTSFAGSAQAAGKKVHGCPSGAVCVYPRGAGWNNNHPSYFFYSYGAHNLKNQVGSHRVLDNQYGGADAWLCLGYNGTGKWKNGLPIGSWNDFNLSPINSIKLTKNASTKTACNGHWAG